MKLIIDIDEKTYSQIKSDNGHGCCFLCDGDENSVVLAICNGTVLPDNVVVVSKEVADKMFPPYYRYENGVVKGVETPKDKWHNLKEDPNDTPTKTAWYCCKIKSSDDLVMKLGYEEIIPSKYDGWIEIDYPF